MGRTKKTERRRCKIDGDTARLIRDRYMADDVTQRALAREFRLSLTAINNILNMRTWKHI